METKYTVRQVRVIPKPSLYPPARVRAVRELIGASQEVFAQLLAVSPMTIRSWEQGLRHPSPIARRFLDEIEMAPGHFRGRILTAAVDTGRSNRTTRGGQTGRDQPASTGRIISANVNEGVGTKRHKEQNTQQHAYPSRALGHGSASRFGARTGLAQFHPPSCR